MFCPVAQALAGVPSCKRFTFDALPALEVTTYVLQGTIQMLLSTGYPMLLVMSTRKYIATKLFLPTLISAPLNIDPFLLF
jgi:hypothetical protein